MKPKTLLIFTLLLSFTVYSQDEELSNYRTKRELERVEEKIEEFEDQLDTYFRIDKSLEEFNTLVKSARYKSKSSEIDKVNGLIQSIKNESDDDAKLALIDQLDQIINSALYTSIDQFHLADKYRSNLENVQTTGDIERTELLYYRKLNDSIDDVLRAKVYARINVIPQIVFYNEGFLEIDRIETLKEARNIHEKFSSDVINRIRNIASEDNFIRIKSIYTDAILQIKSEISNEKSRAQKDLDALVLQAEEYSSKLESKEERQTRIDKIIVWTMPGYGVLMLLMFAAPRLYKGNDSLQFSIFESGLILELITVYLLTATILILGISGKINSEVLGTLIGGISGYVLGRTINGKKKSTETKGETQKTEDNG